MPEEEKNGVLAAFEGLSSKPTQEQIDTWKTKYGEVFVSGFSETELYVFRSLIRSEWLKIQQAVADPNNPVQPEQLEELICDTCVLWKSVNTSWQDGKSGTVSTLQEQIFQNSNHVPPQVAAQLVIRL